MTSIPVLYPTSIYSTIVAITISLACLLFYRFVPILVGRRSSYTAIPSPRTTLLPYLSEAQISELPYPPDILPGARDVETPYGVMRVYEFGPQEGRKVVLVHGDTTPVPIFLPLAKGLARSGCRVLLYGK